MAQELPNAEQVQQLLQQVTTGQNVQQAGQFLMAYLKHPASVPVLFDIICNSPLANIRQAAGVLLRKKIRKHFNALTADHLNHIKQGLLQRLVSEPERVVRFTVAELLATLGRVCYVTNQWPDFFQTLFGLMTQGSVDVCEVVVTIVERLCEKIGDTLRPIYPQLHGLFTQALAPNVDVRVRVAAVKAAGALIPWLETSEEYAAFGAMIPNIMEAISAFIAHNQEEACVEGFSVIEELFETDSPKAVILPYVVPIINFVLQVGSNKNVDFNIRQEALTVVQFAAMNRPSLLVKNNLLDPIVRVALAVASEPHDPDVDEYEITPTKFGAQVIDSLTQNVEKEKLYPILMPHIANYLKSANPWERNAAVACLTVAPAGMPDILAENMDTLLPLLYAAFADQDANVKQSACLLLGQCAEFLRPEIMEHHATILPLIIESMYNPLPRVHERACYAAVAYCEHLDEEEIAPHLDKMMTRLLELLSTSSSRDVQEMAISTISAVAASADRKILPYAATVIPLMSQLMSINHPDQMILRARAMECAGVIANSIGKDNFLPYYDFFVQHALTGITAPDNSGELRDYTMSFISNAAESLGDEFVKYITPCVQAVMHVLSSTDGVKIEGDPDGLEYLADENAPDEQDDDDQYFEPEDDEDAPKYTVSRSFVEEKQAALHALGTIALSCPRGMIELIPQCMPTLEMLSHYVHPDVRKNTAYTLECFVICVNKVFPPARAWEPGNNPDEYPLAPQAREFTDTVLRAFMTTIASDDDLDTVARHFESIKSLVNVGGAPIIHPHMPVLCSLLLKAFNKKLDCQADEEELNEQNESVEQEHLDLFAQATEVCIALAQAYGAAFFSNFALIESLLPYVEQNHKESWRLQVVGAMAEIVRAVKRLTPEQATIILAFAMKGLQDQNLPTRSNALYLTGLLFEQSPELQHHAPKVCELVLPLLKRETDPQALDNACGCVGRLIKSTHNLLDLPRVLADWFNAFPLKLDMEEYPPVIDAILMLFSMSHPAIAQYIPHTIQLFLGLLNTEALEHVPKDRQESMALLIKQLNAAFGQQLQAIYATLSQHQRANLEKILQS